jgi:hypothetical protein
VEKNINDKTRERAVVMHGASYCSKEFIQKYRRLGRSLGCPAVPEFMSASIIKTIKEGSCLFIYHSKPSYIQNSAYL